MTSEMLSPQEVAERLKVSTKTVYRWLHRGIIPARRIGGVWRVREQDLSEIGQSNQEEDE